MMTRKEKHEKLDTVVELMKVGNKVAEWAKSEFPVSVEDTEVLAYFEDGVGNVGIRLYGKLMREHFNDVANKMKAEGLNDCEAVIGLEDDDYVTFYGVGPYVEDEAKMEKVRAIVRNLKLPGKAKVTVGDRFHNGQTLTIRDNEKDVVKRNDEMVEAKKMVARAIRKVGEIFRAEKTARTDTYWLILK